MVIALLGLIAYLVADFHIQQINLRAAERRAEGVVRDVYSIIDASLVWAEVDKDGRWPHDVDNKIDIDQLRDDGFFVRLPQNRYFRCPSGCEDYTLTGWDRDATSTAGTLGEYRDTYTDATGADAIATNPDDLIVHFTMPGIQAHSIAAQLPHGRATELPSTTGVYRVEAHILRQGWGRFVLLRNEGRPLIFARDESGLGGSLHNIDRVTWGKEYGSEPRIEFDIDTNAVHVPGTLSVSNLIVGGCITATSLCPPTP